MLRIVLSVSSLLFSVLFSVFAVVAVAVSPACTVTRIDDCEDDGDCDDDEVCEDGECVGDGGEGEGEGEVQQGPEDNDTACSDGGDNDGDGFEDCDDFDCQDLDICNLPEDNCTDGQDNNGNSFVDCADFSCDLDPACAEICDNGADDDGDNRVDCADGGCANSAACDAGVVSIQDIQDETVGQGALVTVENVVVTQLFIGAPAQGQAFGNHSMFLQEPQGETDNNHTYPQFAGVGLFVGGGFVDDPGLEGMADGVQVGDCVTVSAEVDDNSGGTQLFFVSSFQNATGCGQTPELSVATFADIASDTDPADQDQPGPLAEAYEGTLVTVQNVEVATAPDASGNFFIIEEGGDPAVRLFVSDFLFGGPINVQVGDTFSAMSGIYNQFNGYALQPFEEAHLVP